MIIRKQFHTEDEKTRIIEEMEDLFLIQVLYLIKGNFLVFSDSKPAPTLEDQINLITKEQAEKISILQEENSKLLLANAKKEIEINNVNKNLANVTLEIAKIKIEGAV